MIAILKTKDGHEIQIDNVYSVERHNFDLQIKQTNENYVYSSNCFDVDEIVTVILNV